MVIDERTIEEQALPGRYMRWLLTPEETGNDRSSMCVIRVMPGEAVKPAHAHPEGDELVYIVHGSGRVMIDGEVSPVREGCLVHFPQGSIHILQKQLAFSVRPPICPRTSFTKMSNCRTE